MSTQQLAVGAQTEFWTINESGIVLRANMPHEDWRSLAEVTLNHFEDTGTSHARAMFMVGDVLNYGEREYGELYADAIDATRQMIRRSMKTIQNVSWISKSIPAHIRHVDTLTLAHHEAVAKLAPEEQIAFLTAADDEELSVADLKKRVKEAHPKTTGEGPKKPSKTAVVDLEDEDSLTLLIERLADFLEAQDPADQWSKERAKMWFPATGRIIKALGVAEPVAVAAAQAASAFLANPDNGPIEKWSNKRKSKWSTAIVGTLMGATHIGAPTPEAGE